MKFCCTTLSLSSLQVVINVCFRGRKISHYSQRMICAIGTATLNEYCVVNICRVCVWAPCTCNMTTLHIACKNIYIIRCTFAMWHLWTKCHCFLFFNIHPLSLILCLIGFLCHWCTTVPWKVQNRPSETKLVKMCFCVLLSALLMCFEITREKNFRVLKINSNIFNHFLRFGQFWCCELAFLGVFCFLFNSLEIFLLCWWHDRHAWHGAVWRSWFISNIIND